MKAIDRLKAAEAEREQEAKRLADTECFFIQQIWSDYPDAPYGTREYENNRECRYARINQASGMAHALKQLGYITHAKRIEDARDEYYKPFRE